MQNLFNNITTELLFAFVLLLLIAGGILFLIIRVSFKSYLKKLKRDKARLAENLKESETYYEAEIKRNQYLLQQYMQKSNGTSTKQDEKEAEKGNANEDISELIKNKQDLEREMENFQLKNRKLWEQSLAIHKEKERIDGLKQEIEGKHRELTASIHYAKRIQNALLPKKETISSALHDYFILWKPRDIVSGDFYWFKKVGDYTIIVAADCTGHGVPGAFMSMLGIAFLNEVAVNLVDVKANEILDQLRQLIKVSLQQSLENRTPSDGMDMAICIIDHKNNELQFSGANNPLLYIREGELHQIKPTRNPISIYRKEKPFVLNTIQLQEGDQFYIFSDGYLDQFGGLDDQRYTIRRFKASLLEMQQMSMPNQKKELENRLEKWQRDYKQLDDILVIGFRV